MTGAFHEPATGRPPVVDGPTPTPMTEHGRPPPLRVWILAIIELIVAAAVAWLITGTDHGPPMMMGGASMHGASLGALHIVLLAATVAAVAGWAVTRQRALALVATLGLILVLTSTPLRIWAVQSHLIAMVLLETALVLIPLILLTTVPRPPAAETDRNRGERTWSVLGMAVVGTYCAVLIVVHLPAVHEGATEAGVVPLWFVAVAVVVGTTYWGVVLLGAGRVPTSRRRVYLLCAQEVAAFIGLVLMLTGGRPMAHSTPLGISPTWDQCLGGAFMLAMCAVVSIPIYRNLDRANPAERPTRRN